MAIVTEISWDDMLDGKPLPENPARQAWRAAVAEVAEKAKAALPEAVNGRIEKAVAIVLNGDVELMADGKAQIASQSNGTTQYVVCNGTCACRDFAKAEGGWCKHRTAAAIHKRASALAKQRLSQLDHTSNGTSTPPVEPPQATLGPAIPLSEETPGVPEVLKLFITHLHGRPFVRYAGLLALAHERGLQSLEASFLHVTDTLATAQATAVFTDGRRFTECADASPENVPFHIKPHFARMALTRCKARCLRDALNIGLTALEEVDAE